MKKLIGFLIVLIAATAIYAGTTTNFGWNYGTRGQKPWWTEWETLWQSVDTELYGIKHGTTVLDDIKTKGPWIDARSYATLELANTAAYNAGKTLLISSNWTLTANTTLTASVIIIKGGGFTKASNYTLTINGSFQARLYQVFSNFNEGDVTFGTGAVKEVYPQWWGIDGTADQIQFQCAIDSGANVAFPEDIYSISDSITLSGNGNFLGIGKALNIIFEPTAETFPVFVNKAVEGPTFKRIGNFTINYGTATGDTRATNTNARGFDFQDRTGGFISFSTIENVYIKYAYYGYYNTGTSWGMILRHVWPHQCVMGIYKYNGGAGDLYESVNPQNCAYGWHIESTSAVTLTNCGMTSSDGVTALEGQAYFHLVLGLTMNQFNIEGNVQSKNFGAVLYFKTCTGLDINLKSYSNTLVTGDANTVYLVRFNNGCAGRVGGRLGDSDVYTGTGNGVLVFTGHPESYIDYLTFVGPILVTLGGAGGTNYLWLNSAWGYINFINPYFYGDGAILNNYGKFIQIGPDESKFRDIYPEADNTYYLGKNDDDSPLAWKGVILKDTTNGKYYRIEVINGVITATDLTD